jgi:hypothetical protein
MSARPQGIITLGFPQDTLIIVAVPTGFTKEALTDDKVGGEQLCNMLQQFLVYRLSSIY